MKIFFDFEMTGLHQHTTPISLGMITEEGQSFYAEFMDYDHSQVTPWIAHNVLQNLVLIPNPPNTHTAWGDVRSSKFTMIGFKDSIANMANLWLGQFDQVEMWGDVLAYDWILFCELFPIIHDSAERLPRNIYYIPFDLATLAKSKGIDPDFSRMDFAGLTETPHNALSDAIVIKKCYETLILMENIL